MSSTTSPLSSLFFSYGLTDGFEVAQYYRVRHLNAEAVNLERRTEKCQHAELRRSVSWPLDANARHVEFSVIVVVIYTAE